MSKVLKKIHAEIDHDPKPALIMAHVVRLERVVEKLAKAPLDEILEPGSTKEEGDEEKPVKPAKGEK
jgi:hypothetical protein